jgi:hypothetical protein
LVCLPKKKTGTAETVPVFVECLKLLGFVFDYGLGAITPPSTVRTTCMAESATPAAPMFVGIAETNLS